MKKKDVQRSTPRTELRETVIREGERLLIREGERLVSNESKEVNLFARLVVTPAMRWLYAGLYRVGILEVSGDSHHQPGHG